MNREVNGLLQANWSDLAQCADEILLRFRRAVDADLKLCHSILHLVFVLVSVFVKANVPSSAASAHARNAKVIVTSGAPKSAAAPKLGGASDGGEDARE